MKISYQFFPEVNLLFQKFSGEPSVDEYINYAREILRKNSSLKIEAVLIDFRDIDFRADTDDFTGNLERVIEARKRMNQQRPTIQNGVYIFWVDKPLPTALVHLFSGNFSEIRYDYCSTPEQILKLLKLPPDLNDLEHVSRNLKNSWPE
jgi:hypothetical protein